MPDLMMRMLPQGVSLTGEQSSCCYGLILAIVGRFCELGETTAARATRETCGSLDDYLRDLATSEPICDSGEPGVLRWTPDENTPDLVYYQVSALLLNV